MTLPLNVPGGWSASSYKNLLRPYSILEGTEVSGTLNIYGDNSGEKLIGNIFVTEVTSVPVPGALLFMTSAVGMLAGARVKGARNKGPAA